MKKQLLFQWHIAIALFMCMFASCQSWDKWDDPSGNQVYPTLQKVASYSFNSELDTAFHLFSYSSGQLPSLVNDEERGSQVLNMEGGYALLQNPLTGVKVQNGVSLTFWMKQNGSSPDLNGALFSFQDQSGTQKLFFTANGWIHYQGANGSYEQNNPSTITTGLINDNEWHYVAVIFRSDGYAIYVDGEEKLIDTTSSDYDFSEIVQFAGTAPKLYIGYGSETDTQPWMIDDLNIYRNRITSSEIAKPNTGGNGSTTDYIIVGNEDNSTTWWSAFSDLVTMNGNQTMHWGFYNYTSGENNWNNWVLAVTNGKNRDESGYAEYFVLRADAYGWGDSNYNGENISHNFNFDDGSFKTDMQGAYVDLAITRSGNRIDVKATITAESGTVYTYTFYYEGNIGTSIGAFLTCEGAHLAIDPEAVIVGETYTAGSYLVGPSDLSAGWWSYFSNFSKISGDTSSPFVYTFYNNTSGANNWNNWVLVVTNGKNRSETGYAEYFVIRADAYGWGDSNYSANNISASYDWDNFKSQMNGALVKILIQRAGNRIDVTAKVTTADGEQLGDYTFYYEGVTTTDIGTFLTVDGSSLDMRSAGYYPFVEN
ncbi:MAG: hypothetical protein QM654_12785 [Dysgonamonadaceae bacterium]